MDEWMIAINQNGFRYILPDVILEGDPEFLKERLKEDLVWVLEDLKIPEALLMHKFQLVPREKYDYVRDL